MDTEREIKSLIRDCVVFLRQEGYSKPRIKDYIRFWRAGIQGYMKKNSLGNYRPDIGESFLKGMPLMSPSHMRAIRRSVHVLDDFLLHGKVRKRIVQYVHHELPGKIGEFALEFLKSQENLRRSRLTIENHRRKLSYFITHLSLRSVGHISDIGEDDVLSFISSAQNCKDEYLNTIRLFCRFLYEQKYIDTDVVYVIGKLITTRDNYTEDMDFSLVGKDEQFNLESYFPSITEEFKAAGRDVVITRKDKKKDTKIESAFLKDNSAIYDVKFKTEKDIKIKIEVDIDPPLGFTTEQKLSSMPFSFMTRCLTLSGLYAGKMHALLFRNWKSRVKGRDWYDFEWYVRHNVRLDFAHFQNRTKEFNGVEMDQDAFVEMLKKRLGSADIKMVQRDVLPFVQNPKELGIWSNDYFLKLAERIRYL